MITCMTKIPDGSYRLSPTLTLGINVTDGVAILVSERVLTDDHGQHFVVVFQDTILMQNELPINAERGQHDAA